MLFRLNLLCVHTADSRTRELQDSRTLLVVVSHLHVSCGVPLPMERLGAERYSQMARNSQSESQ